MTDLLNQIRKELGHFNDDDLIKVLKRHKGTQHLEAKRITGTRFTVNLYCFNGKYIVSDEKSGESYRIAITENQNIAYQLYKNEMLVVKALSGADN
jgi:hypothetical protein